MNLADPSEIFYEYLRRIGHVVDLAAEPGVPISALHLGAGALTLARYIQATRPARSNTLLSLSVSCWTSYFRSCPCLTALR